MNKCIKGNKEEEAGEGGQERGEGDCTGQRGGEKPGGQVGGGLASKGWLWERRLRQHRKKGGACRDAVTQKDCDEDRRHWTRWVQEQLELSNVLSDLGAEKPTEIPLAISNA